MSTLISFWGAPIQYADYTEHYTIDAHDMPLPEDMGHFRRSFEKRRFRLISDMMPSGGGARLLDVGCGNGWLTEMLDSRGFNVVGIDLGFDSLERAAHRLEKRGADACFVQGDAYRLPFPDDMFDVAVTSEMLEHLDRPADALREIARVVRPGGTVVVSTPYRERIEYTLCIHCNRKTPVNAHLHSFDESAIQGLLGNAGCRIERIMTFGNRVAERAGMAGLTSFLPHHVWRLMDWLACAILGRQSFMSVRAVVMNAGVYDDRKIETDMSI